MRKESPATLKLEDLGLEQGPLKPQRLDAFLLNPNQPNSLQTFCLVLRISNMEGMEGITCPDSVLR